MATRSEILQSIFDEAIAMPADQRGPFLDARCAGDPALRSEVESLLAADDRAGTFMAGPTIDANRIAPTPESDSSQELPRTIGPYTALQVIGEGGFGTVYLAEQQHPVRRRVALKVIKLGMDTRQVIARFEAERQALTMMEHPNIAKVLDVGTTEAGRPFFVMELVKGIPITDYCDQAKLTTQERLGLFIQVCRAVQHAHQKGVIHRDLKPTNVLVTLIDDKPVPKVIDFGIAKATGHTLTERTLFTNYAQMLGTPLYMSPEQAQISGLDVDTRSDVYSLGVMLYELLTGTTPFDRERMREAAYDEMRRIIRDEDPPKPSTRLSTSATLPSIAACRHTEPARLSKEVRGELDWIVMKALEKERSRRYETASALGTDLQRYLVDEPVEARPATRFYRLMKFSRRHRVATMAGLAVVAAVLTGLTLASVGFIQARRQMTIARTQAARATQAQRFLQEMLTSIDPDTNSGATITVRQVLDRAAEKIDATFAEQPETRIALHETVGQTYYGLLLYKLAEPHLQRAVDLRRQYVPEETLALADALLRAGQAYSWDPGQRELALSRCNDALALYSKHLPDSDARAMVARSLASQLAVQTAPAAPANPDVWAARALPIAMALSRDQIAQFPSEWAGAVTKAQELGRAGDLAAARAELERGHRAILTKIRGCCDAGDTEAARQFLRQTYAPYLRLPLLRSLMPLVLLSEAWELQRDGMDLAVVELILREAVVAGREVWGPEHPQIARALNDLAIVLQQEGKFTEAERFARDALAMRRKSRGMEDAETIASARCLIDVLAAEGKHPEADSLRREFKLLNPASAPKHEPK